MLSRNGNFFFAFGEKLFQIHPFLFFSMSSQAVELFNEAYKNVIDSPVVGVNEPILHHQTNISFSGPLLNFIEKIRTGKLALACIDTQKNENEWFILTRLLYKNRNQLCKAKFFQHLKEINRILPKILLAYQNYSKYIEKFKEFFTNNYEKLLSQKKRCLPSPCKTNFQFTLLSTNILCNLVSVVSIST